MPPNISVVLQCNIYEVKVRGHTSLLYSVENTLELAFCQYIQAN